MSSKTCDDWAVHSYFSPYDRPYDAFIAFMNVLRDLRLRMEKLAVVQVPFRDVSLNPVPKRPEDDRVFSSRVAGGRA